MSHEVCCGQSSVAVLPRYPATSCINNFKWQMSGTNCWPRRRLRLKCDGTRAETRFRLSAKRTSPFKSAGASVQSTTGSQGVRISGSNTGYTMFQSSVKSTGYPLHSPVSPSLPLPCVTVCHHISTELYQLRGLHAYLTYSPNPVSWNVFPGRWGLGRRGEVQRKREVQCMTLVLVLLCQWKTPVPNTSATRTSRAGTFGLSVINGFEQLIVAESYSFTSRISIPLSSHFLNNFQDSSYQNWTVYSVDFYLWRVIFRAYLVPRQLKMYWNYHRRNFYSRPCALRDSV
jgi:hypothetical protein